MNILGKNINFFSICIHRDYLNSFNNMEILLYSHIQLLLKQSRYKTTYVDKKMLCFYTGLTDKIISKAYSSLVNKGVIQDNVINESEFTYNNKFIQIDFSDLITITRKCYKNYKYYLLLISTRNYKITETINDICKNEFIGNMTRTYFANALDVSLNTISRYNKELADAGVIYFVYPKYKKNEDYCIYYGKMSDKEYIDKYLACEHDQKKTILNFKSMTVKYTWLCKGKHYSAEEIEEIENFCKEYNKIAIKHPELGYKPKDMDVFKKINKWQN